ncbi:MAG: hypothetical protein AAF357_16440 [Verrucomicrobiota bacterium]
MKLTKEQTEYLGDAIEETESIVDRCLELLRSRGHTGTAAWTDPKLTSTSERNCLQITKGEGHHYGYGDTKKAAAIQCFVYLWHQFVTVPNAAAPSESEISLRESGKPFAALDSYINRTGETLRIARARLKI